MSRRPRRLRGPPPDDRLPRGCDYRAAGAAGYFAYFGARAGHRSWGHYSFNLGGWHLGALNSECTHVGGHDLSN